MGEGRKLLLPSPTVAKAGIPVFHSSPHAFNRFSNDYAFSGEGAQVFGPGNYFSDSPKISGKGGHYWNQFDEILKENHGQNYHEIPSYMAMDFEGRDLNQVSNADLRHSLSIYDSNSATAPDHIINDLRKYIITHNDFFSKNPTASIFDHPTLDMDSKNIGDKLSKLYGNQYVPEPYTYEALLHANKGDFINQDRLLSTQPDIFNKVKDLETKTPRLDMNKLKEYMGADKRLDPFEAKNAVNDFKQYFTYVNNSTDRGISPQKAVQDQFNSFWSTHAQDLSGPNAPAHLKERHKALGALLDAVDEPKLYDAKLQPQDAGKNVIHGLDPSKLSTASNANEALIKTMQERGIPGTTYLAGGSRDSNKVNPDYNYTVWDPNIINITKRYAIPGALGAGGVLAGSGYFSDQANASPTLNEPPIENVLSQGPMPSAEEKTADWFTKLNNNPELSKSVANTLSFLPGIGSVDQGYDMSKDFREGNYGSAALSAGLAVAPFMAKPVKAGAKSLADLLKYLQGM